MNAHDLGCGPATPWALRYESLRSDEGVYVFPCDEWGNVPLNELGRNTLLDYLFARRMVGRTLARPRVIPISGEAANGDRTRIDLSSPDFCGVAVSTVSPSACPRSP